MTYLTWLEDGVVVKHSSNGNAALGERAMKRIVAAAVLLAAAGALPAQTIVPTLDQPGRKGDMARLVQQKAKEKFDTADRDKDGKLSQEEVAAAFPYMTEHFAKYDKDGDGFLSWEEFLGHNRWKKD
ncbi:EF-hand domain-containing protein [Noviherbaspirillum sp. UKPF54]|uniref:EF-hand domain-containing protein n=1 Tax=Noviherbaspirillum sp. UKPF54 TaxID=2601898 RepID=UPI00143D4F2E|nr:EF-hand domain-containing protein [Noviherbaspirillum sp. UKPF54]